MMNLNMEGVMFEWVCVIIAAGMFLSSCAPNGKGVAEIDPADHEKVVQDWVEYRVGRLTEPTGWLRLAGMMPIVPGENRFGSGEEMDIRFPEGTMPEFAGVMVLEGDRVTVRMQKGVELRVKVEEGEDNAAVEGRAAASMSEVVSEVVAYDGKALAEASSAAEDASSPRLFHGNLEFFVIKRGDLHMVRLYNYDNPAADRFEGFPRYPLDLKWRVEARFNPAEEGKTIRMVNILDQLSDEPVMGTYFFEVDGVEYSLDALEGSETRHFVIVGDETNRTKTYQAGRYIYVDHPDENGKTVFDFNMMYNPPCAFSAFTTCLLPPPQNRLDVAIEAGELRPQEEWRVAR